MNSDKLYSKCPRVGLVSLGCSKNAVDSEILLGELKSRGFDIVNDAAQAEIIIVNTCGFIESAKTDSIDTILDMAQYKTAGSCKLLVVTGCLSQRYGDELARELPELNPRPKVRMLRRAAASRSDCSRPRHIAHICALRTAATIAVLIVRSR